MAVSGSVRNVLVGLRGVLRDPRGFQYPFSGLRGVSEGTRMLGALRGPESFSVDPRVFQRVSRGVARGI